MVNFSRHENEEKSLAFNLNAHSKAIKKSKTIKTTINQPIFLDSSLKNTVVSLKSHSPSIPINKNSLSNTANHFSSTTENFQPFSNFSLFPSTLQTLFQKSQNLTSSDLKDTVYKLKVPNNNLSYKKKIEKFRLLSLSQETFVQSYLKDKYQHSLNPCLLRDYYGYMKSKIQLNSQIDDFYTNQQHRVETSDLNSSWQNKKSDPFNKSYLCTPTTTFNESFLPEDIMEAGAKEVAKEMQVKFEAYDDYIDRTPCKNYFDFDGNDMRVK